MVVALSAGVTARANTWAPSQVSDHLDALPMFLRVCASFIKYLCIWCLRAFKQCTVSILAIAQAVCSYQCAAHFATLHNTNFSQICKLILCCQSCHGKTSVLSGEITGTLFANGCKITTILDDFSLCELPFLDLC